MQAKAEFVFVTPMSFYLISMLINFLIVCYFHAQKGSWNSDPINPVF